MSIIQKFGSHPQQMVFEELPLKYLKYWLWYNTVQIIQLCIWASNEGDQFTNSPQSTMVLHLAVSPVMDPDSSTILTTSIPLTPFPNPTCFPSSHWITENVINTNNAQKVSLKTNYKLSYRSFLSADEKLRSICIWSRVCHGQNTFKIHILVKYQSGNLPTDNTQGSSYAVIWIILFSLSSFVIARLILYTWEANLFVF